jgi:protein TonB
LPLFFTEALPLNLNTINVLPAVPHAVPPPVVDSGPRIRSRQPVTEFVGEHLVFHQAPKGPLKQIVDELRSGQPCVGICVVGATGTGSDDHNLINNLLGGSGKGFVVPTPVPVTPKTIRISVMNEGLLIRRVTPAYPQLAMLAHQQGTVLLHAIIGRDGTIQQLQAVSGPPLLIKAAMDAVAQWRYRPYVLNDEPVEVDTQITVNFRLGG